MANTNRTLAELRTAITEDMKLNPGLITDTERNRFINRALLDLSDMQLFEKEVTLGYTDGVITLPDDFMSVVYVLRFNGAYLKVMPLDAPPATGGTPVGYIQKPATIELWPKPSGEGTVKMSYIYRLPQLTSDEEQPDLPNGYDDLLVDFAVALCHRKNGNMGIYREYMGTYNLTKESLRTELTRKLNTRIIQMQNSDSIPAPYTPFGHLLS